MIKVNTYYLFFLTLLLASFSSCTGGIDISTHLDADPQIYPDYSGVTVPVNIAPLDFFVEGEGTYAVKFSSGSYDFTVKGDGGSIIIPDMRWHKLVQASDTISVTVCRKEAVGWSAFRPFAIYVSRDSIDRTLVYRLLPPLYGTWREIGIYQRDLESYSQCPIYENVAYHGNCVNCHSFCQRDPERMLFHLRGEGAGTYVQADDLRLKLDTKTDSTISNFTYPYWHPSGRYVAFSVNDIFQIFHTTDPNRTEVIDDASDVVVYDLQSNRAFSSPLLKAADRLETFPAFSADGRTLYFCSAEKPDTLPDCYKDVHYSLCAISFDPDQGTFGSRVDTLYTPTVIDGMTVGSVSFPRPSPDGQRLVATLSNYGNFTIWHKDADLWMYDIASGTWSPMEAVNSDDVESYHSWSSNSRWMVFSSRRDDGYYTRPYIVHIDEDGRIAKPFMLPQYEPKKYYCDQLNSFNIPELVSGPVSFTSRDVVDWIATPSRQVTWSSP